MILNYYIDKNWFKNTDVKPQDRKDFIQGIEQSFAYELHGKPVKLNLIESLFCYRDLSDNGISLDERQAKSEMDKLINNLKHQTCLKASAK